ncbi:Protein of unknown function [Bacillus mobilis]|nr:Protein of unknown function [Bacillus mobilis]
MYGINQPTIKEKT